MESITETRTFTGEETAKAAAALKQGGLVAVPTETVYGVAANAGDEEAVGRIYDLKGRAQEKAISVLVTGMEMAQRYCRDIPDAAYR